MSLDLNTATQLMSKDDYSYLSDILDYDMKRSIRKLISLPNGLVNQFFSTDTHIKSFFNTDVEHFSALRAYIFRKYVIARCGYTCDKKVIDGNNTLLKTGYIVKEDFLNDLDHKSITRSISNYISKFNMEEMAWDSYLDADDNKSERAGTCFLDYDCTITQKIADKVTKIVNRSLNIQNMQTQGRVTLARHNGSDPSTLMHLDNMGILSIKWFYFPFDCQPFDRGFTYGEGTALNSSERIKLVESYCPKRIGVNGKPQNKSIEEVRHKKIEIRHFNRANTLVIADTSGLHCRYPGPKGSLRITLQGGFTNTISNY